MAEREDDDLRMAIDMSLQASPPDAKRSKPLIVPEESPESRSRRVQRELMAAAAENRMRACAVVVPKVSAPAAVLKVIAPPAAAAEKVVATPTVEAAEMVVDSDGEELSEEVVEELYSMVFGSGVSRDILAQWSNQGIKFSSDPETCMGLVQHEGGPCGVLAAIQAFVLKNLLFSPEDLGKCKVTTPLQSLGIRGCTQSSSARTDAFTSLTEDRKARALVHSMVDILFLCGARQRTVIATLSVFSNHSEGASEDGQKDETKSLGSLSIESASDFQRILRVKTYTSREAAFRRLMSELPVFRSRMGAMLFLISALLSRGLERIQADRDDPSLPLVTAPFGHASQEIVNLLLCGQAVPNVFDGRMDLGGGMFLKGIPGNVEVGFLTLLESLNFCKVGQYLKCPKWPIWVVGSESHYTVLFAPDPSVQEQNAMEERESQIRKAFDAQDQSGGGGFVGVEGFNHVLREANINLPPGKLDALTASGFIVWSEFWQALLELDQSSGGFKDSAGLNGKKQFDIYHFNGIAKSVANGNQATGGESPLQRPRLCKLRVSVPPRWSREEFMSDVAVSASQTPPEPSQHAPLVDCIRTRWSRAVCSWVGDAPSIV
ncbi:ubiquitin carboxyl-terminal hydrolase FAM188A [Iris pallida]|uniref:Ubiquitin carboxyl-terminal hydrolase FAM188A n=1 Tax=Iris pallida TaxID=29817 RepID=A0AAX6II25_IRIPA|nr:ubiquitin carboxyl-terminal hydrolase FAM188A [Iris pallida]